MSHPRRMSDARIAAALAITRMCDRRMLQLFDIPDYRSISDFRSSLLFYVTDILPESEVIGIVSGLNPNEPEPRTEIAKAVYARYSVLNSDDTERIRINSLVRDHKIAEKDRRAY